MKKYRYIILFLLALFAININADCLYKIGNRKSSKDIKSGDKIIIEAAALIGNTGKYLKGQPDIALMAETSFIYSAGLTTECIWEVVDAKAKDTKYNDKELYYLRMVSDGYYLGFATDTGTKNVRCLTTKTSNAYTFVLLSPTEAGTKSGSSPAWDNNSVIFQCTSKNIQLGNSPTSTTNSMVWMYAPTADNAYTFQPWNVYEIQEGEDAETLRTNIADLIKQIETDDTDYYSLGQFNAVNDFTKAMNIANKAVENGGMTALEYKDCYDNLTKAYVGLQKPFADLLDVVFNLDGTATDISPMQQTITKKGTPKVTYNETFGCNMVSVDNTFGGSGQNYYRTNPYSNNKDFISRISDGHTLEAIFRTRVAISNKEAKWFSSHQGGGFGLMLCTAGNGKLGGNEITYLPNISASGSSTWRWATSGVVPEINTFYHVVGVWNKDEQKAYIYVNGKLRNSVSTPGNLVLPSSSCQWIGIGADPSGTNSAEASGAWDIVTSRIYDQPLTDYQVSLLYNKMPPADEELVTNIDYMGGLNITTGIRFPIDGEGFTDSDNIILTNSSKTFTVSITKTSSGCYFIVPSTMTSGDYKMTLQRGQRSQFLGVCSFKIGTTMPKGCQVIAHRGFWTKDSGTAQNSRQAIRQAMELNIYGAETDVWVTSDGHVMVNHDGSLNGVSIQNNPYSTVCQLKLSNGETIPELEDLFKVMDEYPNSPTKLIIEVKFNNATNIENNCKKIVEAVRAHNIQNRVEYISYSLEACRIIAAMEPDAWVASLGTNPDSPATLYKDHIMGLDYSTSHYNNNPSYIPDAEKLGMTTNVYTIDTQASIINVTNMNIDFVTTNYPDIAKRIYRLYDINKPEGYNTMRQLRSYIIECEGDTTSYNNGKYIQSSVDSYNKTLEAARNAVLLQNSSEQEYSTLLQALKLAHRNLLPKPIADALDVKFNADATVTDFSSLANNIEIVGTPSVYQHPAFNANVAILNGSFGSAPTDFFKVDYNISRTNGKLKDALQNGHSLELIFRLRSEVPSTAVSHLFSGNRSGASALFMSGPQIAFSVNSSIGGNTSSQHIVTSGIQAKVDTFYHAIGVWDAKNQTETIYINGKKCAEQSAVGLLHYPIITSAQWYCIGGSPYSSSVSENGGNYEIESAKIYSSALTVDQVQYLWDMVHQNIDEANTLYTGTKTIKTCHNENLYGFQVSGVKTTQSANIDGINIVNSRKFFNH